MNVLPPVHVIGATGRSGQALTAALHARGRTVIPVVRSIGKISAALRPYARQADLEHPEALAMALHDAQCVISTAHARYFPALLTATTDKVSLIGLGSTRKFTRWPDEHGNGVLAGEKALLASGRPGMILHPTMIYGAQGEDNVQRLAALLRRLPVVPLPNSGRSLVQPVYQDDVTRALLAALNLTDSGDLDGPESLVIAGPEAMTYREFIESILKAAGLGRRIFLPVSGVILEFLAPVAAKCPGFPSIGRAEIRRLLEDKAFCIEPMQTRLGFTPLPLKDGLAHLFRTSNDTSTLPAGKCS